MKQKMLLKVLRNPTRATASSIIERVETDALVATASVSLPASASRHSAAPSMALTVGH